MISAIMLIGSVVLNDSFEKEWEIAMRSGAEAKIVFKVVDDEGKPVEGVKYHIALWYKSAGQSQMFDGVTDKNSTVVVAGKCTEDIPSWWFEKDGYYKASGRIRLAVHDRARLKDGKWLPYGQEKRVVLKKIRKPIPMYVKPQYRDVVLPSFDEWYGYDMIARDWVSPHGVGIVPDFEVKGHWNGLNDFLKCEYDLEMRFPDEASGLSEIEYEGDSMLGSPYQANAQARYERNAIFRVQWDADHRKRRVALSENRMLVLRTRVQKGKDGEIIRSHYSKIRKFDVDLCPREVKGGSREISLRMIFDYFFNPTPNDTNLEFDWNKNLFKNKYGHPEAAGCQQ